jgi:hypothetical protein
VGKPSPEFFTPLEAPSRGPQSALVVGDDLTADIARGQEVGAATVLVRSSKGDRPQPGAEAEPDAVVDSVAGLPGLLQHEEQPTARAACQWSSSSRFGRSARPVGCQKSIRAVASGTRVVWSLGNTGPL